MLELNGSLADCGCTGRSLGFCTKRGDAGGLGAARGGDLLRLSAFKEAPLLLTLLDVSECTATACSTPSMLLPRLLLFPPTPAQPSCPSDESLVPDQQGGDGLTQSTAESQAAIDGIPCAMRSSKRCPPSKPTSATPPLSARPSLRLVIANGCCCCEVCRVSPFPRLSGGIVAARAAFLKSPRARPATSLPDAAALTHPASAPTASTLSRPMRSSGSNSDESARICSRPGRRKRPRGSSTSRSPPAPLAAAKAASAWARALTALDVARG